MTRTNHHQRQRRRHVQHWLPHRPAQQPNQQPSPGKRPPPKTPFPPRTLAVCTPSQNWLFGVNCGFNGGWSTFADLNVLCRFGRLGDAGHLDQLVLQPDLGRAAFPTARGLETAIVRPKVVLKATTCLAPTSNAPAAGACCASGVCSTQAADDCQNTGGTWQVPRARCAARPIAMRRARAAFRPPKAA